MSIPSRPEGTPSAECTELLRHKDIGPPAVVPMPPGTTTGWYPLSFAQERIWLLAQSAAADVLCMSWMAVRLTGLLNVAALERSLAMIVERHESLRTIIRVVDGQPLQHAAVSRPIQWTEIDLSAQLSSEREPTLYQQIAEAQGPFDLTSGPLLRATLLVMADDEHILLLTVHPIVFDACSEGIVLNELTMLYASLVADQPAQLPHLPVQYADYAAWQRQWLQGTIRDAQLSYWQQHLANVPLLDLPADYPRVDTRSCKAMQERRQLSAPLSSRLRTLSSREDVPLFVTALTAFALLLQRYSGQDDIAIGTPSAGRSRQEIAPLIGCFSNTLVLRCDLSGNPRFRDLLNSMHDTVLQAYAHQDVPFEQVIEGLASVHDRSDTPLLRAMFALEEMLTTAAAVPDLLIELCDRRMLRPQVDLSVVVRDTSCGLLGQVDYNAHLLSTATIQRLIGHFEVLLEAVAANPNQPIAYLPLLAAAEWQQIAAWNATAAPFPDALCLHELFEAQAALDPEAIAMIYGDRQLTYGELNQRANQLAHHLRSIGVRAEVPVGICVERSIEMLVGLLAILKAGGYYVPLDPSYPRERLGFLIQNAQVTVLLTQRHLRSEGTRWLPTERSGQDTQVLYLDDAWTCESPDRTPLATTVAPDNPAYLLYTSGSTGQPKGVMISHRAMVNFLCSMREQIGLTALDTLLAVTTLAFDIAGLELWLPLTIGARVQLVSRDVATDPIRLAAALRQSGATVMQATPMTWRMLVESGWSAPAGLKVLCGGEALVRPLANALVAADATVWNLYGPTETTIWSMISPVTTGEGSVPIGYPIANTRIYLLDRHGNPVPVGVAGELYIGGAGLARGYYRRPDLTAERFVPDPLGEVPGARLYRTGDLARYLPDGNVEFLGRIDQQIKLRGFRIEPGEIEAALRMHPAVREAIVLLREDQADHKRIVAYIVENKGTKEQTEQECTGTACRAETEDSALSASDLRSFLLSQLPSYMLPSAFVTIERWPLTPNGKVDRKALPAPSLADTLRSESFVAPRTPTEEVIAGVWEHVLRISPIGVENNFFALGGDSLLATQVVTRLRDLTGRDLSQRLIFEAPTIAALAVRLAEQQASAVAPIQAVPRDGKPLPLSFAQQRLWFLHQLAPDSSAYNLSTIIRLTGPLNVAALEQSLNEIVRRHETLRTTFVIVDEQPAQALGPPIAIRLPLIDLEALEQAAQETRLQQAIADMLQPFDLGSGPLIRTTLIRLSQIEHMLLCGMHHIVSDDWSRTVLMDELGALYVRYAAGQASPLAPLPIQYADYTLWQRQWLQGPVLEQQLSYWRQQLHEPLPVLALPTDRPRPSVQTEHGATYRFTIPQERTTKLVALSRDLGATLFMTLLAAFKVVLARYSGQRDLLVGAPIAGRTHTDTETLIGFFVNTLALRTDLGGNPSFRELLKRVRDVALNAYAHGDIPFEKIVEELQPQRDLSRTPVFQVMFALQNTPQPTLDLPGLTLELLDVDHPMTPFDLSLMIDQREQKLTGVLEYNTDLFNADTMQRMMDHLLVVLACVVVDPDRRIGNIPLLTDAEQQLLSGGSNRLATYPDDVCIHTLIARQALLRPEAIAVVFADQQLTYRQLNQRANQVAHLLQARGVGPETRIGLCTERSAEMMIGLLAILKAGGAYVPLDPAYPSERLHFMVEDAQAPLILTQQRLLDRLPATTAEIICLDRDWPEISQQPVVEPSSAVGPDNLAYVIYTSGSTGQPKGAMVQHRSLVSFTLMVSRAYSIDASDRMLQFTSLSWDTSVEEIFPCLTQGATLVLRPEAMLDSMAAFVRACHATGIHVLNLPTAVWHMLTASLAQEQLMLPPTLRLVIIGGERALPEHVATWRTIVGTRTRLLNTYGLAEATVEVSMCEVSKADTDASELHEVPIGQPFDAVAVYLLDANLQRVPIGVPGEIYVGGGHLARGYLGKPALTAERFMPDPFSLSAGTRMYRTGDVGRYRPDGQLEFVGRVDQQVKIRGHRVELGEVEVALHQHPAVSEAAALVRAHTSGDHHLIAYVVLHEAKAATDHELRAFMQAHVPDYMVPSAIVQLDAFPLTPNGKIDGRALPAPDHARSSEDKPYVAPRTPTEQRLAEIWQSVLGVAQISSDDDFFRLGGHSLLATKVLSRIGTSFGLELPLRSLFEYSTLAALAEYMTTLQWANQDRSAHSADELREEGEL